MPDAARQQEVRQEVERLLNLDRLQNDDWDVVSEGWCDDELTPVPELAQKIAEDFRFKAEVYAPGSAPGLPRESSTTPPASWVMHSERVLAEFETERLRIRVLFEPIVSALLRNGQPTTAERQVLFARWLQPTSGRCCDVPYPLEIADRSGRLYRVTDHLVAWSGETPPGEVADPNPLFELAVAVERLSRKTGLREWDAAEFLLGTSRPTLPWIDWAVRSRPATGPTVVVTVGSPTVRPDEVAAAYSDAIGSLSRFAHSEEELLRKVASESATAYVRRTDRTVELVRFVGELKERRRSQRMDWRQAFEMWTTAYPDWPYSDSESMRVAYYQAVRPKNTGKKETR